MRIKKNKSWENKIPNSIVPFPFLVGFDRERENALERQQNDGTREVPVKGVLLETRHLPNRDETVRGENRARNYRFHDCQYHCRVFRVQFLRSCRWGNVCGINKSRYFLDLAIQWDARWNCGDRHRWKRLKFSRMVPKSYIIGGEEKYRDAKNRGTSSMTRKKERWESCGFNVTYKCGNQVFF